MKVLHLINTLSAGGAELHLLNLCRHLKRQGIETVVACLREHVKDSRSLRRDFENDGIRVVRLRADSRYDWRFLGRVARLLKSERPNILHTHLPRADIAAALIFRQAGFPAFVCSVHGIYRERWFGSWAAPFMRRAYRQADAVIAISCAVKNWLGRDLGISTDKVRIIHYGIEPERFAGPVRSKTSERRGRATVGSIGRLEPGKGFNCLVRAMEIVCKQVPSATLRIAGHDPLGYGKTLEALIAKLALNEHVQLIGFQSDVPSFLSDMDVFAFASRSEGFGQVIIEAMAAGKPVVASKIPPLTEIVQDSITGLLVNPDDPQAFANAISWLLAHPEQAGEMGRRGQERVYNHFSAQRMADETLCLYESLGSSSHYGVAGLSR
ncbi:MAG: glycosyltransferase [Deltaproteobacteria bacterium]|nr:glycosyltransferase [Deltaproteobacteria bacterium]